MALDTFLAGVTLDLIAFPTDVKPGEIDADVVYWLGVMDSPAAIVPALIGIAFYSGYRLNRSKHALLREELDRRNAADVSATGPP